MEQVEVMVMEISVCPECGQPAEVVSAPSDPRAAKPEQFVGIRCIRRHWFFGMRARLVA